MMSLPVPPSRELPISSPVVVLSDLHLGHPATYIKDPSQIMPLLGPAKTAIFNGDTFEQLNFDRRAEATRMLGRLFELCFDRGVRPFMLTGNHDARASSLHYLDLFDGRVFITHGDILHEAVAPWSREAPCIMTERTRLQKSMLFPAGIDGEFLLMKRSEMVAAMYEQHALPGFAARGHMIAKFLFKPWRIILALHYWARATHYARTFISRHRPSARLMLFGHSHRPGIWKHGSFTLVNTGSFQPLSYPLVVHLDDKLATIHRTEFRHHAWHLGAEQHRVSLTE